MEYILRRVSPFSALFYGLLVGFIAWLLPGAFIGWLAGNVVTRLARLAESLQFEIPLPLNQSIPVDLIELLQLGESEGLITALATRETALMVAVALAAAAAGMLLTGFTALLGALAYNLFASLLGGVQLVVDPVNDTVSLAVTPSSPAGNQTAQKSVATTTSSGWLVSASDQTRRWRLSYSVTRIGSSPENDIVLPELGPQHAEIRREKGSYVIYDLGTRQTWVNTNQVATTYLLKNGARLQLGTTEFVVHILTQ